MARFIIIIILSCTACLHATEITVSLPEQAVCFQRSDITITIPTTWLPGEAQLHDAYDADRNQEYVRLALHMQHAATKTTLSLPVFFMRSSPEAAWQALARWTPTHAGIWQASLDGSIANNTGKHEVQLAAIGQVSVTDTGLPGLLQNPPAGGPQRYFHRSKSDGSSAPLLLHGACRAWMVSADTNARGWNAHEHADRQKELLPALREHGYNLLHQWMAPWEYQIMHLDDAEFWRQADDSWSRTARSTATKPWQRYDQGRAAALDVWLDMLAGQDKDQRIYTLLAPLPHVSFQLDSHPWGGEGCWSKKDDPDQSLEKCNGFSALLGDRDFWEFFYASPGANLDSWESQCFDHQANYFRYIIARWSASPSLGIWEIFDEIDAIGDDIGLLTLKTGWWSSPRHQQWLKNICSMFNGSLQRVDGLRYAGDPYRHPLHCATTSHAGGFTADANMHWTQMPDDRMSVGWHWYPMPGDPNILTFWAKTVHGIHAFSQLWKGQRPHFLGEFGYIDRLHPDDETNILYPSLYHFAIWASVFNGQAVSAMDWDDGKEYGEIRPRQQAGVFHQQQYPIHNGKRLDALRLFINDIDWSLVTVSAQDQNTVLINEQAPQRSFILCEGTTLHAWALFFSPDYHCQLSGISNGTYTLQFFNPWTAMELGPAEHITVSDGTLIINSKSVSAALTDLRKTFGSKQRLCQGFDIAWRLKPLELKTGNE